MASEPIYLEKPGDIAHMVFNHQAKRHALNRSMP
jgi:hypothetical protein